MKDYIVLDEWGMRRAIVLDNETFLHGADAIRYLSERDFTAHEALKYINSLSPNYDPREMFRVAAMWRWLNQ